MLLIPAIDLQKGRCVRLRQGDLENNITVYNEDAVDQACQWADLGAERIHIVDLDGAKTGKPVNAPLIREMIEEIGEDAEIEVGGGIRTLDQIEAYLDAGVRYAVIGTAAGHRRRQTTENHRQRVRPVRQHHRGFGCQGWYCGH
jgi:phosphoribosylformimino-5-aminoimidazole carboxamide ribotide isomerase